MSIYTDAIPLHATMGPLRLPSDDQNKIEGGDLSEALIKTSIINEQMARRVGRVGRTAFIQCCFKNGPESATLTHH